MALDGKSVRPQDLREGVAEVAVSEEDNSGMAMPVVVRAFVTTGYDRRRARRYRVMN